MVAGGASGAAAAHSSFSGVSAVKWWDDDSLLITHTSGQVTVCLPTAEGMVNLLDKPEILHTPVATSAGFQQNGCKPRAVLIDSTEEALAQRPGEDPPAKAPLHQQFIDAIFTEGQLDSNSDFPFRQSTFRLSLLQSMTPLDVFERAIIDQEYGTATAIAKRYGLCADAIYTTQWEQSEPSEHTIHNFLRKVTDDDYVFYEIERITPHSAAIAHALYRFGVARTPRQPPDGTFTEITAQRRRRYLQWLDRIETYKMVLEWYDSDENIGDGLQPELLRYRDGSLLEIAVELASSGQLDALRGMAIRHYKEIFPHLLSILLCVPVFVDPTAIASLLPKCTSNDEPLHFGFADKPWRSDPDWSENDPFVDPNSDDLAANASTNIQTWIDDEGLDWTAVPTHKPSAADGAAWFKCRVNLVERMGFADHAFSTAAIGVTNGFTQLDTLARDLKGLCAVVYATEATAAETAMLLVDFQKLNPIEKAEALLRGSSVQTFPLDFWGTVVPLLSSNDLHQPDEVISDGDQILATCTVTRVLVHLSVSSLARVHALVCSPVATKLQNKIGKATFASTIIRCVYACTATNETALASAIHDRILRDRPPEVSQELSDLEKVLLAVSKIARYVLIFKPCISFCTESISTLTIPVCDV